MKASQHCALPVHGPCVSSPSAVLNKSTKRSAPTDQAGPSAKAVKESASTTTTHYKESDFPPFSDEFPLTKVEYIEYKRALVGQEVGKQYISDGDLKAAGYTSWVNFNILFGMMNN